MQDLVKTWATVWEFSFSASQNYSQRHQRCSRLCNLEVGKSEFCAEQEEEYSSSALQKARISALSQVQVSTAKQRKMFLRKRH